MKIRNLKIAFHPIFLWDSIYSLIWLSDSRTNCKQCHSPYKASHRKEVYEEKIKMPSQSGNSDKGKQPGHIEKPDIEKHTISGARKEWKIMYTVKRIKKKLKAWRNHVNIAEVQTLSDYLRENVFNDEALELLVYEDYESLANVAVYADFGISTAIQATFCMGYEVGKAGRHSDEK